MRPIADPKPEPHAAIPSDGLGVLETSGRASRWNVLLDTLRLTLFVLRACLRDQDID